MESALVKTNNVINSTFPLCRTEHISSGDISQAFTVNMMHETTDAKPKLASSSNKKGFFRSLKSFGMLLCKSWSIVCY